MRFSRPRSTRGDEQEDSGIGQDIGSEFLSTIGIEGAGVDTELE